MSRRLFRAELGIATAALILMVVTLVSREWIELLTGWDPDGGDGTLGWAIVVALALTTLASSVAAHVEWHRAAPVTTEQPRHGNDGTTDDIESPITPPRHPLRVRVGISDSISIRQMTEPAYRPASQSKTLALPAPRTTT